MKLDCANDELKNKKTFFEKNAERYKKIYVFGAGIIGEELYHTFKAYNILGGYVDNSLEKQKCGYLNHKVYSLEEYLLMGSEHLLIVAVSNKNKQIIVKQLEENGLHQGVDFELYDTFLKEIFPILSLCLHNKAFVYLAQISLTERCTLKCKKCAHACYAVDSTSQDLSLEQVYKSADSFFSKVDYIHEFVLIGGEPLLYKDLTEAISYIGEKYRDKMGIYSITTNGTIVPSEAVLDACEKYRVMFRVSNYTKQIPRLEEKHCKLKELFNERNIGFQINDPEREWMDYGFEYVNRQGGEEEFIEVFDNCKTECREIRENRFYYCVMARSVSENLNRNVGKDDYLDLDKLEGSNYREELLKFSLGYLPKGYLDMCKYCHGKEAYNYPIPAAEQVKL